MWCRCNAGGVHPGSSHPKGAHILHTAAAVGFRPGAGADAARAPGYFLGQHTGVSHRFLAMHSGLCIPGGTLQRGSVSAPTVHPPTPCRWPAAPRPSTSRPSRRSRACASRRIPRRRLRRLGWRPATTSPRSPASRSSCGCGAGRHATAGCRCASCQRATMRVPAVSMTVLAEHGHRQRRDRRQLTVVRPRVTWFHALLCCDRRRRHRWSPASSWRPSNSRRTTTQTSTWTSLLGLPTCVPATTPCRHILMVSDAVSEFKLLSGMCTV